MDEPPPQSSPPSTLVQANPQIAAALSVNSNLSSPMQPQNQQNQDGFVQPNPPMGMGGGGPVRIQPVMPQMRQMPYPPPQMRQMPPPQGAPGPHFSPMNMQQQQQFGGGGQMQMPPQRAPMQPQMGMGGPGPSHPMGMQGHQQGGPQFVPNNQPMGPPQHHPQHHQQHPQQHHQPPPQHHQPPPPQQHHQQQHHQPPPPPQQQQQHHQQHQQQHHQQQPPPPQQQPMTLPTGQMGPIMDKSKLDDLMAQISSTTVLEDTVKETLVEYADDFVTSIIDKAAKMLQYREVKRIEGRDIEFILKNVYNMPVVPRSATHIFGPQSDMVDLSKEKHVPTEAHKQRVALLKKQLKKV